MIQPNFLALCAEFVEALKDENTYTQRVELIDRARTALATPPPEPTDEGGRKTILQRAAESAFQTLEGWDNYGFWVWPVSALEQARRSTKESLDLLRTALATAPPELPTDDELNALWNCCGTADEYGHHEGNIFEFARAVLERWGHA